MDLQAHTGQPDRLSALPDGVIGHILSFLSAKEAARAAVLARRWRHAFAAVHTLSFEQEEGSSGTTASDDDYNYTRLNEEGCNTAFVALVDAAFSSRRRCAGASAGDDPGLRAFRVAFDSFHHSLAGHVDRWLSVAARAAVEIYVDARRTGQRACTRERSQWYYQESYGPTGDLRDESDGEDADDFRNPESRDRAYRVPRELYSSPAAMRLQTLCLGSCLLDLPGPGDGHFLLPYVETLALRRIPDSGRDIQRLVSACPRLADLTLDSCRRVRSITVVHTRLRRLALRCCHGARLAVDASELRALEYKGSVPGDAVLSFLGSPPAVVSCDIEFCGRVIPSIDAEPVDVQQICGMTTYTDEELVNLAQFLGRFADDARSLSLASFCLGSSVEKINGGLAPFLCLRHLELKGILKSDHAIDAVTAILERTPMLEVLTLLIMPDGNEYCLHQVTCDTEAVLDVPDVLPIIPCLRDRVREINVVHYQGRVVQRKLLKLLLRLAMALDELYLVFPKGKYAVQNLLMGEIYSWVNPSAKVMFA